MNRSMIPAITTDQMREVDRLMIEEYGISLEQMMENAGRNLAELALEILTHQSPSESRYSVVVACGGGNNGGGGMVSARFLSNRGVDVTAVLAAAEDKLKPVPRRRWETLKKLPITTIVANASDPIKIFGEADLIVDAIIGYGLTGELRGVPAHLIRGILNSQNSSVLSLDAPSGLNATDGRATEVCIRAYVTMTLGLPKTGLLVPEAGLCVGQLYLADIGVPPDLYTLIGLERQDLFKDGAILDISS